VADEEGLIGMGKDIDDSVADADHVEARVRHGP
jgi:hypothetical protein